MTKGKIILDIKEKYTHKYSKEDKQNSLYLNKRLFNTYNRIINKLENKKLEGVNVDLGSGNKGFTNYCESISISSTPYDYPQFNLEVDILPHNDASVDFVTLNAVIEHIKEPSHILKEIHRVLKKDGFVFIRTPNWQMDYKNFYNDPTHVKPYSPITMKNTLELAGFKIVFLEPGLIEKSWFWWDLPDFLKWKVCSYIKGGTKSILAVGKK